jgi:predicted transcriptional regulator
MPYSILSERLDLSEAYISGQISLLEELKLIRVSYEKGKKGISLAPGQVLTTWAKFPAPPTNVDKISIYISRVQPFEDVPIGK